MSNITRRDFIKLGTAGSGLAAAGLGTQSALTGSIKLAEGGKDFSPETGKERKAVPSACWQCVTRDGIVGFVEDGRLVKVEGNPKLPRTNGKLCSRGQAGVNVLYNPDRLLSPLKRVGKRGEGKWQKISWDEALDLLVKGGDIAGHKVKGLKTLLDEGHPEKFMFHYGRMKGSDGKIVKDYFLAAYGTKTVGNHTSICESAKWTAHELTWGAHYDNWDFENTKCILNFGSNVLEAHTNHVPAAQRCIGAIAKGTPMYTFDVRLSNTAARSTEWIPVKPGTDLAIVLAMSNVLLQNGICDKEFIETYTNVTCDELKVHLAQYTPEWAEGISGVPAEKIRTLALTYGRTTPSVCISYRGAVMHYNGVQTERAIFMLEAIAGNIDRPGGRCRAVGAKWKFTFPKPKIKAKKLSIVDGAKGAYAYPTHHASHQVLPMIDKGPERPDIYMIYCYNPVYVNGDVQASIDLMKDEKKMPFIVAVDISLSESTDLADLVLPDATYLERWTCDDMVCPSQIGEYYIRQPMVEPLGEARNFCNVVCDVAKRLGLDLGFSSAEEFVKNGCENTPGVKEAGGFEYMKEHGAWYDKSAKPAYFSHAKEVDVTGATLDEATGVYYKKEPDDKDYSSLDSKHAAAQYVAQKCGDGKAHKGFPPDKHRWKTGILELRSKALADKGFDALPTWMSIPEHEKMAPDDLILTTFKVNVQTHSRTQNCKWLTEIYHENPAWLHPKTAAAKKIKDGDMIKVKSSIGEVTTKAHVTESIVPGTISISYHCGHWAWGGYASGKACKDNYGHVCEPDCHNKWWGKNTKDEGMRVWRDGRGVHVNWIIPNVGDPIGGGLRWMDTVVKVTRA
ncbi:MAG: molybdopterin-containing oxidoreductase family protein [Planctomycetota bacterium]|jgi:anaerobic selenocysteine-containing dehydrogenase